MHPRARAADFCCLSILFPVVRLLFVKPRDRSSIRATRLIGKVGPESPRMPVRWFAKVVRTIQRFAKITGHRPKRNGPCARFRWLCGKCRNSPASKKSSLLTLFTMPVSARTPTHRAPDRCWCEKNNQGWEYPKRRASLSARRKGGALYQ